jgi:Skp family chaperone for outer membrane proteins
LGYREEIGVRTAGGTALTTGQGPHAGNLEKEENRTVKRTVITLSSILAVGVAAYVVSHLRADPNYIQPVNAAGPAAPNKVAVVNLMGVLKQYRKWTDIEETLKAYLKRINEDYEKQKNRMAELKKNFESTADTAARDQIQTQVKQLEREVQDYGEKAKKEVTKYREENAVQVYKEIQDAVQRYARANDIGLVLHYEDGMTPSEVYHPMNVMQKCQTQACIPLYVDTHLDITGPVADMLNKGAGGQTAPAGQR